MNATRSRRCINVGVAKNASLFIFQTFNVGGRLDAAQTERFPTAKAGTNEHLPVEIEQDRREALNCHLNSQHRAAILMARSALQRAVRTLDPEFKGTLFEEIANLERRAVITAALSKAAHEVRLTGNDVAHPSEMGTVMTETRATVWRFSMIFLTPQSSCQGFKRKERRRDGTERASAATRSLRPRCRWLRPPCTRDR